MSTNKQLVDHLINSGVLRSPPLIDAFRLCDRLFFVPEHLQEEAYADIPLPIGEGQTISQPYTVAIMLELLSPKRGDTVLDIGSGSGWTTALLATAIGEEGSVEGVERIPSLVEFSRSNLAKLAVPNASITQADPSALGKPGHRYDAILVSASASELPVALYDQLKPGGKLVIPIRTSIWCITKTLDGKIEGFELPGFRFVPLIVPS